MHSQVYVGWAYACPQDAKGTTDTGRLVNDADVHKTEQNAHATHKIGSRAGDGKLNTQASPRRQGSNHGPQPQLHGSRPPRPGGGLCGGAVAPREPRRGRTRSP